MDYNINFPNLNIFLEKVGKSISIGGFTIAFYGMIIALGMVAGILLACYMAKKTGQTAELYTDLAMIAIICSVLGARIYYVIFKWDYYKDNPLAILNIRQGGLAIYGGVIAAIVTTYLFCRVRRANFPLVCDTAGLGLIVGQVIGRWGNFFNREAFGDYCDNIFAMQLPVSSVRPEDITTTLRENIVTVDGIDYISVHPTFLYESFWNLVLLICLIIYTKHKKFDGEVFLLYLLGYGVGRFWIEGLRTDQLLLPVVNYPVSQALAAVLAIASCTWIVIKRVRLKKENTEENKVVEAEETIKK